MARGRKSAISLAVMPPALPGEKPAPPAELDAVEERIWRAIVGALPPTWLDAAAQQILVRAVAQAAVCEGQEAKLPLSAPKSIRTPTQLALWRPSTPLPEKIFRICSESCEQPHVPA